MLSLSPESLCHIDATERCSIRFTRHSLRSTRTPRMHARPILSSNNGDGTGEPKDLSNGTPKNEDQWQNLAFPTYLQSEVDDFCQDWDEALQLEERRQSALSKKDDTKKTRGAVTKENPVWQAIRKEAATDAADEPILSSFLYASILSHETFELALAAILANRLSDPTMMATELIDIFHSVLRGCQEVEQAALADVIAVRERDPSCTAYSSALLYYKGYHALQTHRIAHGLWERGQRVLARSLQYRCTQTLAVDIHPAAKIGKGVLLDHGTGLVIGETAVVGNNVSILHNVTLGGTGKDIGDRHPKVSDNVLIGANATILGNITIGKGAQVAAGSLVLKDVPPRTMVAGSPAKEVGKVTGNPALKMQHWMKNQLVKESYSDKWEDIVRSSSSMKQPEPCPTDSSSTKLPAEFGTKDKVPASGTAPMGLSDYKDKAQWADRKEVLETQGSGNPKEGSRKSTNPEGFLGGDGARLSSADSAQPSHRDTHSLDGSSPSTSGRHQEPNQARPVSHGHIHHDSHSSNGASPSSSTAKSNGASQHNHDSIGDTSQVDFTRSTSNATASSSNGAVRHSNSPAQHSTRDGSNRDGTGAETKSPSSSEGATLSGTTSSAQHPGNPSARSPPQGDKLSNEASQQNKADSVQRDQAKSRDHQTADTAQEQRRADVAASISQQTPSAGQSSQGDAASGGAPKPTESQDFDYWI